MKLSAGIAPLIGGGLLAKAALSVWQSGLLEPLKFQTQVQLIERLLKSGGSAKTLVDIGAARYPHRPAIIDDRQMVTWHTLAKRTARLVSFLKNEHAITPNSALAIMCRNSIGAVEAIIAGASTGAELVLLNTEFPAPQLGQALARHRNLALVLCDEEFTGLFKEAGYTGALAVVDNQGSPALTHTEPPEASRKGDNLFSVTRPRITLLTSGTTGVPKGAPRTPSPTAISGPMLSLINELPLQTGMTMLIGPPLFHGFGLGYLMVGLAFSSTMVVHKKFSAHNMLSDIGRYRPEILTGVPVMYRRLLELPEQDWKRTSYSSVQAAITGGAPSPPDLCEAVAKRFGPVLYNLYGSSETGFTFMAGPRDLAEAPGSVGRPVAGVRVELLDKNGNPVPTGMAGRIFIGSEMLFDGYSGGGDKERIRGLMSTGDLGRFDSAGRLFVEGREDDMIVSGGENVFPGEVEDVLLEHEIVKDAAVIGIDDSEFGQRLEAYVVLSEELEASLLNHAGLNGSAKWEEVLRVHIRTKLARYKMPRNFVPVQELPRNATGKVLKRVLREKHE